MVDIVKRVDLLLLTFFAASPGINLAANFIPLAYGLVNLFPSKLSFKMVISTQNTLR